MCGGLPLDVVVADLVALESAVKDVSAVGTLNVVPRVVGVAAEVQAAGGGVKGITGGVVDFLVTCLSP